MKIDSKTTTAIELTKIDILQFIIKHNSLPKDTVIKSAFFNHMDGADRVAKEMSDSDTIFFTLESKPPVMRGQ